MSIHSTGLGKDQALVVSPARAKAMLDCGTTRLYELIAEREIDSFRDGRRRKIVVASIEQFIARRLEEHLRAPPPNESDDKTLQMLRRGRPRRLRC